MKLKSPLSLPFSARKKTLNVHLKGIANYLLLQMYGKNKKHQQNQRLRELSIVFPNKKNQVFEKKKKKSIDGSIIVYLNNFIPVTNFQQLTTDKHTVNSKHFECAKNVAKPYQLTNQKTSYMLSQ